MRRPKDYLLLYLKGVGMGGADVIPGVSGGTIAFITGIYEELILSIKQVDSAAVEKLLKLDLAGFWKHINGNFLITVLGGVLTSLLSLARLLTYFLENQPIAVWSFFFGLIVVSSPLILRDIHRWHLGTVISFLLGIFIAYEITILSPTDSPSNLLFIFFYGALAICAMILPGISGAFILLLIGKYEFMITALITINLPVILVFAAGCVTGLIAFSRVLSWILEHYRYPTLALLAGFMLGSLNKVWPWKEVIAYRFNHEGVQVPAFDKSVFPARYLEVSGHDPKIFSAILFAAAGIFLVVAIEKTAAYVRSKN